MTRSSFDPVKRMSYFIGLSVLFSTSFIAASHAHAETSPPLIAPESIARDMHSYANIDEVQMTHVYLNLNVNFERKVLDGYTDLTLAHVRPNSTRLVLDTKGLNIKSVQIFEGDQLKDAPYTLGKKDKTLGSALTIQIAADTTKVRIAYETTADSDGLSWASPEQTFDKKKPLMYSLSQSIYGRTWFPQQDTPAIRVTYAADITTPPDLVAKMSAVNAPDVEHKNTYHFDMPQPMVPYLIALSVGDYGFSAISPRSGVYAEKSMIDKATNEFADTEKMIQAVESMYGKYAWDRYDILVMPPSFPFGGMEHARLTFATPTIITGNRDLVSLVSHELAHSWSGNLVTNRYWRDLWLNEGFTTYVEKRIIEKTYGTERADLERAVLFKETMDEMKDLEPAAQKLAINLKGKHPDDVFTEVPYGKGSLFLTTLEHVYGRPAFDAFTNQYFKDFAWKTITTEAFENYLYTHLIDKYPGKMSHAKVKEWIYQAGYPKDGFVPSTTAFAAVDAARKSFVKGDLSAAQIDTKDWTINHWQHFIQDLPTTLAASKLDDLDKQFKLSQSSNLILEYYWLRYALQAKYQPAITQRLQSFLSEQGRLKLTKPLYQEMIKTPAGIKLARQMYAATHASLHPIVDWEIKSNVFEKNKIRLN